MSSDFSDLVDSMRDSLTPILRRAWADVRHVPDARQHVETILMEGVERRAMETGDMDYQMLAVPAARVVIREFLKDSK